MFFIFLLNSVFSLMLTLVVCQQRALFRNEDSVFTYGNFVPNRNRYLSATKVRSDLIEDENECPFNCIFEPQCYSFNIAAYSDSNGLYLCELLITDKYRAASELRVNDNFHHFSSSNPCATRPCLNRASCDPDYEHNGYQCICRSGYTGRHCEIENWKKLNSVPVCYGARDDAYGSFTISEAGFIIQLTLTHINGSLACSDELPPTYWGCDHPQFGNMSLSTLITFQNKTHLLPVQLENDQCTLHYGIDGVNSNSTTLSFDPFAVPLRVAVHEDFQIWFGQDYQNCTESNNGGQICVDVHAWYA